MGSPRELLLTLDSERREKEQIADIAEMELLKVDLLPDHVDTAPQKSPPPGPWTEPNVAKPTPPGASGVPESKSKGRNDPKTRNRQAAVVRSST